VIQILEIGSKKELLQHFLSKRNTLIAGLLIKSKARYITHNDEVYRKLIDKQSMIQWSKVYN
jgi:hypothetical protein